VARDAISRSAESIEYKLTCQLRYLILHSYDNVDIPQQASVITVLM
jgi:uncharacterized protein with HEPN domain